VVIRANCPSSSAGRDSLARGRPNLSEISLLQARFGSAASHHIASRRCLFRERGTRAPSPPPCGRRREPGYHRTPPPRNPRTQRHYAEQVKRAPTPASPLVTRRYYIPKARTPSRIHDTAREIHCWFAELQRRPLTRLGVTLDQLTFSDYYAARSRHNAQRRWPCADRGHLRRPITCTESPFQPCSHDLCVCHCPNSTYLRRSRRSS